VEAMTMGLPSPCSTRAGCSNWAPRCGWISGHRTCSWPSS
jgi:hypothetical protein